ncbi:MAG: S41 family peptidase [Bacteroidales bacterium]|nr:S41 family peptidase [Bacteroidales bacterium]
MKNSIREAIIIAVLGIAIGAISMAIVYKSTENKRLVRTETTSWRKLNLILQSVDANYVDSVDRGKVSEAAITAALASLDPHSVYMPPVSLEASEEDLAGQFEGIGIQFNVPNDTAIVIEVIPGGPSEKIGLAPGDRLLKVDGTVIAGVNFPQDSMVRRMKGKAGTKVSVTVGRDGEEIPFEITRDKIPTHSVDAAFMVNDTTAYLRLSKFARTTYVEVLKASAGLLEEGMKKLIFDVRDNSGGFFDQALLLSNMFLPKGAGIVYMEGLHRKREDYNADGKGLLQDIELCVLVNEGSASSSEIFAGAIQDNGRGKIIGRRSFGKGLVQEPMYFTDGSGVRLTVARFYTPSGRCIQKPYSDDYDYEVLKRYGEGEMVAADSMKIEKGGILPDVFVPIDTTKAGNFYLSCNRKATAMRFASSFFDAHKDELSGIERYEELLAYLEKSGLESGFLSFARQKDGLVPSAEEWAVERQYMMTQVNALVGRYSKLGDNAFYHLYLQIDETYKEAIKQ